MEELPETVLSVMLGYAGRNVLNLLQRTSTTLTNKVGDVTKGSYQWKLMTESYLGLKIDLEHSNWQNVYKFVTLIGENKHLLFCRDVFFAKLGLLAGIPLTSQMIEWAINSPRRKQLSIFLTFPS